MNIHSKLPDVSIITTCKGRLRHLQQSLPTMLAQETDFDYEVIVVDYGCPDGAFDWCREQSDPRVTAVRVLDDITHFNVSRARNCGSRVSAANVLAFVDADMLVAPQWLDTACLPILDGKCGLSCVQRHAGPRDRCGTFAISSPLFHQIRGFDESFAGWGPEDGDLYARAGKLAAVHCFSTKLLNPLRHGNFERTQFYREKSIRASSRNNQRHMQARIGPVNPDGYGAGDIEMARATSPPQQYTIGQPRTAGQFVQHLVSS